MELETLYKKTSTGKIQQWKIWVVSSTIFSESGQVDGKKTLSKDTITKGKNVGRANETTPIQQAVFESRAKHIKKLKTGYVTSLHDAKVGKLDKLVAGGYVAMTALSFYKYDEKTLKNVPTPHAKKIEFPCAVQPKLDGLRCCASQGLFTRSRKAINSIPHIFKAIFAEDPGPMLLQLDHPAYGCLWDGELYNHEYKDDFEKIVSLIKREKELHEDYKKVQYHIYDLNAQVPFSHRMEMLQDLKDALPADSPLVVVETKIANNLEELNAIYEDYLDRGYEGAMARNLNSPYEGKRSKHLQKMKLFEDAEFKIIGVKEGRGKLAGKAASFTCEIDDEHGYRTFEANLEGTQARLQQFFENPNVYIGKWITVKFQGYTKKNHVPRINTGLTSRGFKNTKDGDY